MQHSVIAGACGVQAVELRDIGAEGEDLLWTVAMAGSVQNIRSGYSAALVDPEVIQGDRDLFTGLALGTNTTTEAPFRTLLVVGATALAALALDTDLTLSAHIVIAADHFTRSRGNIHNELSTPAITIHKDGVFYSHLGVDLDG